MRRQVHTGMLATDGLTLAILLVIAMIQVTCANDDLPSKEPRTKSLFGLLKDYNAAKYKKGTSLLDDEGLRFKKSPSLLNDEGLRFKKGSSLLDDEGLRFKKGSYLEDEGLRFKKGSYLEDEGLRFKKGSYLEDEGMRFKKASYLEDEGMRFKKMPAHLLHRNAIIRKSVLDGEGLRFKKGTSLLDDEGMRFKRSRIVPKDRSEEGEMSKRYGFPGRLFSFYPFNMDLTNSYERRSDRSGNRDILEGEGMRF